MSLLYYSVLLSDMMNIKEELLEIKKEKEKEKKRWSCGHLCFTYSEGNETS